MAAMAEKGEPLGAADRLFHEPGFNCCIIGIVGVKTSINTDVVKQSLQLTLLNYPRFSSLVAAANLARRVVFNATMSFSNVVGPQEEISFYGHPITYLAPSVYGHPQALTIHLQSYADKMTIVVAAEKGSIPDPHRLCDDLVESLELIKGAVLERGLVKAGAELT